MSLTEILTQGQVMQDRRRIKSIEKINNCGSSDLAHKTNPYGDPTIEEPVSQGFR